MKTHVCGNMHSTLPAILLRVIFFDLHTRIDRRDIVFIDIDDGFSSSGPASQPRSPLSRRIYYKSSEITSVLTLPVLTLCSAIQTYSTSLSFFDWVTD